MYEISLYDDSSFAQYKIITSNNFFNLEGIENLGFGKINNHSFSWTVEKIGPASSMDDYVTNFFNVLNRFTLQSGTRTFSTEP